MQEKLQMRRRNSLKALRGQTHIQGWDALTSIKYRCMRASHHSWQSSIFPAHRVRGSPNIDIIV